MRKWKDVSLDERDLLVSKLEGDGIEKLYPGLNLRMSIDSLKRKIREHREYGEIFLSRKADLIDFQVSPSRQWVDYIVEEGDDWIIAGDIEVPDHCSSMLKLVLLTAMARGIKKLIISGDLLATDQQALNSWITTWKTKEGTYEEDIARVNDILSQFAEWFTTIIIIEGNHDDRIARKTGGEIYLGMFIPGDIARYSRYSYMYIKTSNRGLIKVVHPETFSKQPVSMAQSFYAAEVGPSFDRLNSFRTMEKCHFVVSHTHIDQAGWSPDGVYEMHGIGTCRDPQRTAYKNKGQNRHYQWNPSFMVIQNGHFEHMHMSGTDWKKALGNLYKCSPMSNLVMA